eukprot:gene31695-36999_t
MGNAFDDYNKLAAFCLENGGPTVMPWLENKVKEEEEAEAAAGPPFSGFLSEED